jgi:predicted ATPase/DNA-binding CsgD family transcriptional regulator
MNSKPSDLDRSLLIPLTRRQSEILALLAQGYSGPEISEKLAVGTSTVRFHLQHLYGKLGVNSKRQALSRAAALGLLPPAPASAPTSPPLPPHPAPTNNLPLEATRFFGREAEIESLKAYLTEHRLVTLSGPGGVGKTRLALRVAQACLADFPDGVWLTELAPLFEPALVGQQLAFVLGVPLDTGRPVVEAITSHLQARRILLILDNCEHLLDGCGRLIEALLAAGAGVRLLATSRQSLSVAGEFVFEVPSLAFPDPTLTRQPHKLENYAAVRMLVDRAGQVSPGYRAGPHNATALARICQRLDGVPLALEMAAARLRILSAQELAERLDDMFSVLTQGARTALPRHQTLRAMINWSYDLLDREEQLVLQRLSVFAGGCTLDAAEAICSGAGVAGEHVLDRLASLVDKSMVVADRHPGATTGFHLLEMVRQYAAELLRRSDAAVQTRTQHRDYFLSRAEGPLDRQLDRDYENLRLALEWSFTDAGAAATPDAGPRLVHAMWRYWNSFQDRLAWCQRGIAFCRAHPEMAGSLYAQLLLQGSHAMAFNDPHTALRLTQEGVAISRGLGAASETLQVELLCALGLRFDQLGDAEQAEATYAEAEAVFQAAGAQHYSPDQARGMRARFIAVQANSANRHGQPVEATRLARESIELSAPGDLYALVLPTVSLGEACLALAEYDQARAYFLQALRLADQMIGEYRLSYQALAKRWLAAAALSRDQVEQALADCRESLRLAQSVPDYNTMASALAISASVFSKLGHPERAARLCGAARLLYAQQGRKPTEDLSLDAVLPGWRGRPDQADIWRAFEAGQAMGNVEAITLALSDGTA